MEGTTRKEEKTGDAPEHGVAIKGRRNKQHKNRRRTNTETRNRTQEETSCTTPEERDDLQSAGRIHYSPKGRAMDAGECEGKGGVSK